MPYPSTPLPIKKMKRQDHYLVQWKEGDAWNTMNVWEHEVEAIADMKKHSLETKIVWRVLRRLVWETVVAGGEE
jgi:hypothetical protein